MTTLFFSCACAVKDCRAQNARMRFLCPVPYKRRTSSSVDPHSSLFWKTQRLFYSSKEIDIERVFLSSYGMLA